MSLSGDLYRYLLSIFTKRPSRFGWLIKDKLAGSGRLMTKSQLAWVTKNGIKSVFTIREYPLPQSWFPPGFGIDYKHLKVENYGAPPVDELDDAVDYIEDEIKKRQTCTSALQRWKRENRYTLSSIHYEKRRYIGRPSNSKSEGS